MQVFIENMLLFIQVLLDKLVNDLNIIFIKILDKNVQEEWLFPTRSNL